MMRRQISVGLRRWVALCLGFFFTVTTAVQADVINVPGDQPTITAGVTAAVSGDQVVVEAGTYDEADALYFNVNDVSLVASGTVTLHVPSAADAAIFVSGGVTGIVVDGVKIERTVADDTWKRNVQMADGASITLNNCEIDSPACAVGVILFNGADLTAIGCTFGNFASADWASAILMEGASGDFSNLDVQNCTFATGCNGWIKSINSPNVGRINMIGCDCRAALHHSAFMLSANSFDTDADMLVQGCQFEGSTLEMMEFFYNGASPKSVTFRQCQFEAYDSFRKIMWYDLASPTVLENCVFAGGKHETLLTIWGGPPSFDLIHCTLVNDGVTAAESASGIDSSTLINGWDAGRVFNVTNCLFYSPANYTAALAGDSGSSANRTYAIDHSVIDHGTPAGAFVTITAAEGYTTSTLVFQDESGRDYRLADGSPGNGEGVDWGIGVDVLNGTRPLPAGSLPDMGAYETAFVPVTISGFEIE